MLRLDLFDLVDGLFRGVVYFFYNIFETVVHLVRRPFRGPLKLYRRRRQPAIRQLAGPTFLFLCFFAFSAAYHFQLKRIAGGIDPHLATQEIRAADVANAVVRTPGVDADWLWLVLVTSLTATVAVDAVLRLVFSSRRFGTPSRRALAVEAVEYALFWPILLVLGLCLRVDTFRMLSAPMIGVHGQQPERLVPFLLLAMVPAALLLAAGLRTRPVRQRLTFPLRLASLAGVAVTMFAALLAGGKLGQAIVGQDLDERATALRQGPMVLDLDCALSGPVPHVAAIIWHRGTEPTVLYPNSIELLIARRPEDALFTAEEVGNAVEFPVAAFDDPPGQSILFQPGEARRIRLLVPAYSYSPGDAGKTCALRIRPNPIDDPFSDAGALGNDRLGTIVAPVEP
jgi:hypothetical protein